MWIKNTGIKNQELGIKNLNSSFIIHHSKQEDFPKIMLVDMNSFFASVEQQANPKFRNKPLGVCPSVHETSCIIAASKEAKAVGIKTGTLIYKAKKIYPKIILVQSEPEKYREVSRAMNEILRQYSNRVARYSIDESFLGLSDQKLNPLIIGSEIKQRIKDEVGEYLTCSVGIGPNKFIAKLGSDLHKPDGLTIIWRSNLPEIYKHLKFSDLWGVARGWTNRLNALGIDGPSQMLNFPVSNLLAAFGKPGFYIWQRICGLEVDVISTRRSDDQDLIYDWDSSSSPVSDSLSSEEEGSDEYDKPKSFGHSWVLNFRTIEKEKLRVVIMRLAEKAARRMRSAHFKSGGVYLSVTDVAGNHFHVSKKLKRSINTGEELYLEALILWKNWSFIHEIMHIAVGFIHLLRDFLQLDLFSDKNPALIKTLDHINDRYGEFTIRSGLLVNTSSFAPDAIAFGK